MRDSPPPSLCDALCGTYRRCGLGPTVANIPSCLSHQLTPVLSTCSWPEVLRQLWTTVSQPLVATEEVPSSHGFCTHSCHCRKAAPHGSSVPKELLHFLLQSLLGTCSKLFCPLQHVSQCTPSTTQQALTHEEEEQVCTSQHKGFLPQTPPVRNSSALCLTSPVGFISCGTV